jgi:hypothetical protein
VVLDITQIDCNFGRRGSEATTVTSKALNGICLLVQKLTVAYDLFATPENALKGQTNVVGPCDGHAVFHDFQASLDAVYEGGKAIYNIITGIVSILFCCDVVMTVSYIRA